MGKAIDLLAIFALIAGTATTFSLATPLLSTALNRVFGLPDHSGTTIAVLLLIAFVYTVTVWYSMKGISKLASYCAYLFLLLLIYFLYAVERQFIFWKRGFLRWEIWFRILLGWLRGWIHSGKTVFHKAGRFIIGPIGWFGVSQPLFYWNNKRRTNNKKYNSGRIWMGTDGNLHIIYYFR